ncbi:MAG: UDP-N-acetylglucosamine 4,6-dehydratase (inverting) [Candidatus Peregrinibacteria bacterium]
MATFDGITVLVTGGTGSFGKKFVEIVLREHRPKRLIVFSRDELKQSDMRNDGFNAPCMRYFIGDVRDRDRLHRAMAGVDVVVHAAALKHVPACEYNPIEAVQTNIGGARNILDAALDAKVKTVLALSTDKAVNPVNLYGATKLVAEKIFIDGNSYSGMGGTKFACVRYGNVVGSRGSVIPLFLKQRPTGTVTLTDERMTRFWITLEQGVQFVIRCIAEMHGGEIFVPKIPSMRVTDLAEAIAPDCIKKTVGIRPGEKLHEVLLSEDEARHSVERERDYMILPENRLWAEQPWPKPNIPEGFRYASDSNKEWLTIGELRKIIA